ncbi:MAG: multicopper oxidase domain-containing protein [Terriglobales bacterium]
MNRREFVKMTAAAGAGLALFKGFEGKAWAFEQSPVLRKFISPLPGLGTGLPVANGATQPDGSVLYKLAGQQFYQQMHPDLPKPTKLWGYVDRTTGNPAYLGPIIVANRGTPVRLRFKNNLPPVHPLPVDTTLMGADMGAAQNRAVIHLHGGFTPWSADGGPFAWFAPDGSYGSSFVNGVPGVKDEAEYYYTNDQSARLLWYHDHAVGITRLNAYAGLASAYLINDEVVDNLASAKTNYLVPPLQYTIPLVLQDKSFKSVADQWGRPGDLWYPYLYEYSGATGRWELGPPSDGFANLGLPPTPSCVPEYFSDTPVINGEAYPYVEVEPRRYLFVLLNASQARFYNLNLFYESMLNPKEADTSKPGPAFIQIANEGGLLPAPVVLNRPPVLLAYASDGSVNPDGPYDLLLAPAERAYIIVDFSQCQPGDRLILYNDAPAPFPGGDSRNDYFTGDPDQTGIGGAPTTKLGKGPNTRTLLQFRVVRPKGAPDAWNFNSTLNALASPGGLPKAYHDSHVPFGEFDLNPKGVQREAKTLNEDYDGYGRLIQRVGTGTMLYTDSFGRNYIDTPTEVYQNGQTVVWDIYNTTGDTHPMHVHLVNVQVLGRDTYATVGDHEKVRTSQFTPPDPNYRGWKETVRVNPGEVTRVIMQFTLPKVPFAVPESPRLKQSYGISGGNEYVWHCHILEHEEHDMMRPLVVL